MLELLPIVTPILVVGSIALSIYTGNVIERLKKELTAVERQRVDAFKSLAEAQHQREGMQGTLEMHERKKTALESLKTKLTSEQETLASEVLPEREIGEAGQREEEEEEESPSPAKKPKAKPAKSDSVNESDSSAPREREIKVRIPMRRRSHEDD